jgi:hypothetical protein
LAGSHRAPRTTRARRPSPVPGWAIAVAVVVALVPATWLGAHRVFDDSASPRRSVSTDLPIPPVSPSTTPATTSPAATPSGAATPSPSGTPSAKRPARLTRVPPDTPRRIVSGSLIDTGFDSAVTGIETASTSEVARWGLRGAPGSPGTDTVYVFGMVYTSGADSAFAHLPSLRRGARIEIRTDSGTLTYTVRTSRLQRQDGLAKSPEFLAHAPGRLVLVGIRYAGPGRPLPQALVVTAELTGARRG